ncbi:hypothetical protein ACFWZ1_09610 [Frateuria sp. GZRe14]|uniref:hypothetical protein n=1 Tax=Frateuria sp. GZRe14 TaxID=3351534 RepID=UPI003EDBA3F7
MNEMRRIAGAIGRLLAKHVSREAFLFPVRILFRSINLFGNRLVIKGSLVESAALRVGTLTTTKDPMM